MKFFQSKKIIYGCEERGDAHQPYLTRYTLVDAGSWQICLHIFHRSDWTDDMHDHPWNFLTILLWRGYTEETPTGRRRYYPGSILWRPATHIHRVEIPEGKKAITLVWMGKRRRDWGFWRISEFGRWFTQWQKYFIKNKC